MNEFQRLTQASPVEVRVIGPQEAVHDLTGRLLASFGEGFVIVDASGPYPARPGGQVRQYIRLAAVDHPQTGGGGDE